MGYRSEVRICLLKKNFDELVKRYEGIVNNLMKYTDYLDDSEKETVVFGWDWIKWYPDFDDVAIIEDYLANLDENTPYAFVRVGEERGDIEEYGNYCDGECDRIRPCTYIDVY